MNLRLLVLAPLLLGLAACGTISRGTNDRVEIDVTPADARVRTSLGRACIGSCTIRAPRTQDFTVTASRPGFTPQTVEVKRRISMAGAGGVARNAMGGPTVVGVGVDLYTGAAYDHVPNPVVIVLEREAQGPSRPSAAPR